MWDAVDSTKPAPRKPSVLASAGPRCSSDAPLKGCR